MKLIESATGSGKLRREDDERLHDVVYKYEKREVVPSHPYQLTGTLPGINWEIGQTLHGKV